jgi:hypothetical protein
MEFIRAFILMGILSHSSNKAALNWSRVEGWGGGGIPTPPYFPVQMELQPMRQWRRVFFTDKWQFTFFRPDGQRRGERFADACVLERDRFGGGKAALNWSRVGGGIPTPPYSPVHFVPQMFD